MLDRLWTSGGALVQAAIVVGAVTAVTTGARTTAWILIAAITAAVALHLGVSVISYRRTMARPWPQVEPLRDDEWD